MSSVLRTMLYVPANSWRMITNSLVEMEDAVILDLEDAVSLEEKETGRVFARDSFGMFNEAGIEVYVRTNSIDSSLLEDDLAYVADRGLTGIVLPKTEKADDIRRLDEFLTKEELKKGIEANTFKIVPLVENPLGIDNVFSIATASPRLVGLAFGAGDFLREMGVGFAVTRLSADEYFPAILYARSRIAQAAQIAKLEAIDTPFFGLLIDFAGLAKEAEAVKLLGFTGKMVLHPRHVEPVNRVFGPSGGDVAYAKAMVAAYEEARARGAGSASYGGRMIDYAMHRMGLDMLAKAEKIAQRESTRREKKAV